MEWKPALQGTYGPNLNAFWWVAVEIWTFEKLAYKTVSQCDGNADAHDRGDCNSSPCTSYRRAKNYRSASFPWGIYIWNFKTLACTVHKIWHASKMWRTMTHARTHARTDGRTDAQLDMPPKLLRNWGHNKWMLFYCPNTCIYEGQSRISETNLIISKT